MYIVYYVLYCAVGSRAGRWNNPFLCVQHWTFLPCNLMCAQLLSAWVHRFTKVYLATYLLFTILGLHSIIWHCHSHVKRLQEPLNWHSFTLQCGQGKLQTSGYTAHCSVHNLVLSWHKAKQTAGQWLLVRLLLTDWDGGGGGKSQNPGGDVTQPLSISSQYLLILGGLQPKPRVAVL